MLVVVNLVIAILTVAHSLGLQYEVCERMAKNQHENIFNEQHLPPQFWKQPLQQSELQNLAIPDHKHIRYQANLFCDQCVS